MILLKLNVIVAPVYTIRKMKLHILLEETQCVYIGSPQMIHALYVMVHNAKQLQLSYNITKVTERGGDSFV